MAHNANTSTTAGIQPLARPRITAAAQMKAPTVAKSAGVRQL
jgi:hypothetical protein